MAERDGQSAIGDGIDLPAESSGDIGVIDESPRDGGIFTRATDGIRNAFGSGNGDSAPKQRRKRRTRAEIEADERAQGAPVSESVPVVKPKGKRGKGANIGSAEIPAEALAPLVQTIFGIVARLRHPVWVLTPQESMALAAGISGVVKYVPIPMAQAGLAVDAAALAAVAVPIVVGRAVEERRQRRAAYQQAVPPQPFPSGQYTNGASEPSYGRTDSPLDV